MKKNGLLITLLCFLVNSYTYGQYYLDISQLRTHGFTSDSPVPGAVYQRGVDNKATIKVKGYFRTGPNFDLSRTVTISGELKQLDLLGNELQVSSIPIPITTTNQNGYYNNYSGSLTIPGGWYKLQLKAVASPNAQTIGSLTTWVGVGEVFIIAGQSNAQGLPNNSGQNDKVANNPQPTLDAVRVQPYQFDAARYLVATDPTSIGISSNVQVQKPYLSYLMSGKDAYNYPASGIAPLGNSLWYWVAL